jgi:V8-like Glu-specific endopeptidase
MNPSRKLTMIAVSVVALLLPFARPAVATRYRDNLDWVIDRRAAPQFMPIGELESVATMRDDKGNTVRIYGTGVLISPCHVITNHHVVFGDDVDPKPGKDYSMLFRAGVSPNAGTAFQGHTVAKPVVWGRRGAVHSNDWAILKLATCIGAKAEIGWMEPTSLDSSRLIGKDIAVVGFAGDNDRGELSFSVGKAWSVDPANNLILHSASAAPGQSGGAVLVREGGVTRLAGVDTMEIFKFGYKRVRDTEETFHPCSFDDSQDDLCNANLFITVNDFLKRTDVKAMLDEAKAIYGRNPASRYDDTVWPKRPI